MKPKIIYLCYIPLSNKTENNFYMNELIREDFTIEYWDLSNIFFKDLTFNVDVERPYVIKIRDYTELERMISTQNINNCFFIIVITFNGMVIKLHRILNRYDCYLIYFARSGIPARSRNESLFKKFVNNYRNFFNIEKMKGKYFYEVARIYQKFGLIKKYDLVFAAGSIEASRYDGVSKVIPVNHFDYDQYLCLRGNRDRIIVDEYCVFLDDNLIYNIDYQMNNIKTIDPTPYFKCLCMFFDCLEKKYNIKVVIAAHPKAKYQGNEFGDRPIIYDKTNELVKDCQFTIAHYSTSIAFAVLYEKPLLFIYTDAMKAIYYFDIISNLAAILGASIYNIESNENIDAIGIKEPDKLKYNDYRNGYLTSEISKYKLTKDIFMDYLCKECAF